MSMHSRLVIALGASLLALAACGGGGGRDEPVAEETAVPDSALASHEAFARWVGGREASDSRDPLAMNAAPPPTSESAEPLEID